MKLKTGVSRAVIMGLMVLGPWCAQGCAFLRAAIGFELRRPELSLADVAVEKASINALDLSLTIRVDNPNDVGLEFAKLDYKVKVDGIELAAGIYDKKLSLPPESHVLVKLPLKVQTTQVFTMVSEMFSSSRDFFAEVIATADFVTPVGALAVNFTDKKPLKKLTGF